MLFLVYFPAILRVALHYKGNKELDITVGSLRQLTALSESELPIIIVTDDLDLQELLNNKKLEIVEFGPSHSDAAGKWNPTFKIKVELRKK